MAKHAEQRKVQASLDDITFDVEMKCLTPFTYVSGSG